MNAEAWQDVTVSTEPEQTEDAFQKELVELFGQEALEWLTQIHSALTELEHQPDLDRHTQLVDAIVRGIASLGGSAATVNLCDVERATFALLPFIDTLKDHTTVTRQDYATVRDQFRIVVTSVTMATGITFDLGLPLANSPKSEPAVELLTLLNALRTLQDEYSLGESSRNLISQVMQRLEHEARLGTEQIRATIFHQMLMDLQMADAQLLETVRRQLPEVAQHLSRFRAEGASAHEPSHMLGGCIRQVEHLQGVAKQAHATPLVTFLAGLQSFLSLIVQHRVVITSQRMHSVEARIRAVLVTIEEWITAGERERDAMGRLLPVT